MRKTSLLSFVLLAGCAASPATPPMPASYLALGTEPGWTLEITPGRLNYSGDYGAVRIDEAHGGAQANTAGRSFSGKRLAVTITAGPCSDGMSDRRFAETVTLVADGKRLSGCGGAVLPAASLAGSLWRFSHIGGVAVADESRTELRFAATHLSGSAGCNRFTGSYTLAGTMLTAGPLVMTRMACMGAAGEQEQRLMALMAGPVTIAYTADGAMMLSGADGMTARLVVRP